MMHWTQQMGKILNQDNCRDVTFAVKLKNGSGGWLFEGIFLVCKNFA